MASSAIEWTDVTWNPITGCDRTSPGCDNCYALTLAKRLKAMGQPKYQNDGDARTSGPGFGVTLHEDLVEAPRRWLGHRTVFVNSMSDLFHDAVPEDFIRRVFGVMADTPRHTYQVLTKRSKRLARLAQRLPWPPNVWMGVSRREPELCLSRGPPSGGPCSDSLPVRRASARPADSRARWIALGDRRR